MSWKDRMFRWSVPALVALLAACSGVGTNPAAPPAPLAEIPSMLQYPPDLEVDLNVVRGEAMKFELAAGGEFLEDIRFGPDLIDDINGLLESFLTTVSDLKIPVDPNRRTFEGIRMTESGELKVKVDFRPFDLNGDGHDDPECTGCTCPLGCSPALNSCPDSAPLTDLKSVCYRIWITPPADSGLSGPFLRFMAGRFDRLFIPDAPETPDNEQKIGKGEFFIGSEAMPPKEGESTFGRNQFHARYDHDSPAAPLLKITELFNIMEFFDKSKTKIVSVRQHTLVAQEPLDGSGDPNRVRKTINLNLDDFIPLPLLFNPDAGTIVPIDVLYKARYREDLQFWSGTKLLNPDPDSLSFENACAFLQSGDPTARDNCFDAGIDVQPIPFLDKVEETDVLFPSDFPLLPTF